MFAYSTPRGFVFLYINPVYGGVHPHLEGAYTLQDHKCVYEMAGSIEL